MLVFWKARLALLAVPKTGTTALESALAPFADTAIVNPPGLKHCTVRKYRRELAPFLEQKGSRPLALTAVMREPIDWLGSWYRYRARPEIAGQPNSTDGKTFDMFVEAYLEDAPPQFAKVGSQANFLNGGVDHLYRYEDFPALVSFLEERLGQKIELTRTNVSPSFEIDLSPAHISRLRTERPEDFTLWESLGR